MQSLRQLKKAGRQGEMVLSLVRWSASGITQTSALKESLRLWWEKSLWVRREAGKAGWRLWLRSRVRMKMIWTVELGKGEGDEVRAWPYF